MPTSITVAPRFTHSPRIIAGFPTAATSTSAAPTSPARSAVRECARVTVACRSRSSMATGLPTMFERPTTSARAPANGVCASSRSRRIPSGVHGRRPGRPVKRAPALCGPKPSTSFCGASVSSTSSAEMCLGSGSCTSTPWTWGLTFSSRISASNSTSDVCSERMCSKPAMPVSWQAFALPRT